MKCDELQVVRVLGAPERYNKEEVDEAIKELKEEVNNLLMQNMELCQALQVMYSAEEYTILQDENAELKEENLNLKAKNIELQSFYDLHGNVDNYIDRLEQKLAEKGEVIEDLQKTNSQLASSCLALNKLLDTREEEVKTLKQKLEDVQASMYADVVDANIENRRLKHSLYNLRARYADMMQKRYTECQTDGWVNRVDKWIEVERRCFKKAEEYK